MPAETRPAGPARASRPDREPVAGDLEAGPEQRRVVGHGEAWSRRASRRRRTRRGSPPASRGRRRAGAASRPAAAIAPIASMLTGAPRRAPSKSTTWISGAPRPTKCSAIRSGRSVGAPTPVDTPGQKTIRERPFSMSIAGMTCTRRSGADRAALAAQRPSVEADRQRAAAQERVVEAAQRERRPEPAPLLLAQLEQQHLARAGTTGCRSACTCSGAPRRARSGARTPVCSTRKSAASSIETSPRCMRTSRTIRAARQIASVASASAELRAVVEALLAHHLLAVHAPALDELGGVDLGAGQRRVARGERELQVMARVRLVDAGVADRGAVVLAHGVGVVVDRRRDDVDADRRRIPARRLEVRRERHHAAQVRRRRDDLDPLVRRDRRDVVVDEVLAGATPCVAVAVERRLERRRDGRP